MGFMQLRRARFRGLIEGLVQKVRGEATENDGKDGVERFQDYGFAGNPVDGQGLRLDIGGHSVVVRMDRIGDRPQLAAYEVKVWHKDGHSITLRDDGMIEMTGVRLVVNMSESIALNSPAMTHNGIRTGADHQHGGIRRGTETSDGPS